MTELPGVASAGSGGGWLLVAGLMSVASAAALGDRPDGPYSSLMAGRA